MKYPINKHTFDHYHEDQALLYGWVLAWIDTPQEDELGLDDLLDALETELEEDDLDE